MTFGSGASGACSIGCSADDTRGTLGRQKSRLRITTLALLENVVLLLEIVGFARERRLPAEMVRGQERRSRVWSRVAEGTHPQEERWETMKKMPPALQRLAMTPMTVKLAPLNALCFEVEILCVDQRKPGCFLGESVSY